ncbi:hypothetical protein TR51_17030 [Kitasatospora griseola]|uniref:Uncharacterized protein n=1 Tax=Kitasatospora griseola TaxID=2064 RepID=A0A0D0PSN6_KITGR|nr:hypothetical protein TR51_17030 [Kitasatospora griseola]
MDLPSSEVRRRTRRRSGYRSEQDAQHALELVLAAERIGVFEDPKITVGAYLLEWLALNEPVTRNSTGELPNDNRWWGLSRDLGRYRGVTTLESYVEVTARLISEHAGPWTQAHKAPTELEVSAAPSSAGRRQLQIMAPIPEELAEVAAGLMLLQLLDRSGGQVGRALSPDGFVPQAHARDESGWSVLKMLVDRYEVDAVQVRANGRPNIVKLTTAGRTKAMNLRSRSQRAFDTDLGCREGFRAEVLPGSVRGGGQAVGHGVDHGPVDHRA